MTIFLNPVTETIKNKIPETKTAAKAAFQDKEKRAQMYAKSGGKLRAAGNTNVFAPKGKPGAADAKAPSGLGQTAQPRAANPVTAGDAA